MTKYIPIFLSFSLSVIISIGITLHSYYYAADNFGDHAFLAFIFVAVTEISFISLPYIAAIHRKTKLDSFYVILLYVLSVIPATTQVSSFWFETKTKQVIARPAEPVKSALSDKYTIQLTDISKQLADNNKIIAQISDDASTDDKKYVSYRTKDYKNMNIDLHKQKSSYLKKIDVLDREYEVEYKHYQTELKTFEIKNKGDNINVLSDAMKLFYSLVLVIILQLVNARFAFHGSKLLDNLKGRTKLEEEPISLIPKNFKMKLPGLDPKIFKWLNKHDQGLHEGPTEPGYTPADADEVKTRVSNMLNLRNSLEFKSYIFNDTKTEKEQFADDLEKIAKHGPEVELDSDENEEIHRKDWQEYMAEEIEEPIEEEFDTAITETINEFIEPTKKKEDGLYSEQPEINLNPVKPLEYLQKHKIKGIGDQTLNKFIQHYKLKNTSLLNTFINKENYTELLPTTGLFPEATVLKLIEMLDAIKNR